MSLLNEYRTLERELERHQATLERLKDDPVLQKELAFEGELRDLMASYEKDLADVMSILEPGGVLKPVAKSLGGKPARAPRTVKVYRNPLTGEIVESKGGNNKLLSAWKARFGASEVESWVQK